MSLVQSEAFGDMRVQILADGIFHLTSYRLAGAGEQTSPGRIIPRVGHFRFRSLAVCRALGNRAASGSVDVPDPLPWDLGWLVAFGILPLIGGILLIRNAARIGTDRTGRSRAKLSVAGALSAQRLGGSNS
jgi:hypothetical protein